MHMTMRRRGFLLFSGALAVTGLPSAHAADSVDRILVVGDSQAQGLAGGLQRQLRRDRSWRVIDRSRIATGLCSRRASTGRPRPQLLPPPNAVLSPS